MVIRSLDESLEYAVYKYLRYNLDNDLLMVIHPDYIAATEWLRCNYNAEIV